MLKTVGSYIWWDYCGTMQNSKLLYAHFYRLQVYLLKMIEIGRIPKNCHIRPLEHVKAVKSRLFLILIVYSNR